MELGSTDGAVGIRKLMKIFLLSVVVLGIVLLSIALWSWIWSEAESYWTVERMRNAKPMDDAYYTHLRHLPLTSSIALLHPMSPLLIPVTLLSPSFPSHHRLPSYREDP